MASAHTGQLFRHHRWLVLYSYTTDWYTNTLYPYTTSWYTNILYPYTTSAIGLRPQAISRASGCKTPKITKITPLHYNLWVSEQGNVWSIYTKWIMFWNDLEFDLHFYIYILLHIHTYTEVKSSAEFGVKYFFWGIIIIFPNAVKCRLCRIWRKVFILRIKYFKILPSTDSAAQCWNRKLNISIASDRNHCQSLESSASSCYWQTPFWGDSIVGKTQQQNIQNQGEIQKMLSTQKRHDGSTYHDGTNQQSIYLLREAPSKNIPPLLGHCPNSKRAL